MLRFRVVRNANLSGAFRSGCRSFAAVTATMVKELREMTGAGMMDCKKALMDSEVDGDITKAVDWLRAKGIAKAAKNADRATSEGLIAIMSGGNKMTMLEVNSETDFVARNGDFQSFVAGVASAVNKDLGVGEIPVDQVLSASFGQVEGRLVSDVLIDVVNGIRENIVIKRAFSIDTSVTGSIISTYVHGRVGTDTLPADIQMGNAASVVTMSGTGTGSIGDEDCTAIGRRLAMHIIAARPSYLSIEDVPEDEVARERGVCMAQAEEEGTAGKKPEIIARIVEGKVKKRLGEYCLLEQNHVAEEGSPAVSKFIQELAKKNGSPIKLEGFLRWTLGGK